MKFLSGIAASIGLAFAGYAENWPHLRGPHYNGSSSEKDIPSSWSKTENIAWQAGLPGSSAATPIIWNDRVFVSSTDVKSETLHALCVDRKTGNVLWQNQIAVGIRRDEKSNFASPTPVTDGQRVFFFYGNGELAGFDVNGKKLWARNIQKDYGEFAFQWTFSTSPLLHDGTLYLQVLQRDVPANGRGRRDGPNESYILAMDPATGKALWRHVRPSQAVAESREAFTSPVPFEFQGRKELLVVGGDDLSGHDPKTGKELWRWGTWNPTRIGHWRQVPSPVAGTGVILACAPKSDPIYAIKAGGIGLLDDSAIAWKSPKPGPLTSDVPTPLFYEGDFFVLSDLKNAISRVHPKNGEIKWTTEIPRGKKSESSPTGADGKIYFMNFAGDVYVVDATDGKIVSRIPMGEPGDDMTRSTIAASQGQLFIRTNSKLFCVGKKALAATF